MNPLEQRAIEAVSNLGPRSRNSRIPHEVREAVICRSPKPHLRLKLV